MVLRYYRAGMDAEFGWVDIDEIEDLSSQHAIHKGFTQDHGRPGVGEEWTFNPADQPIEATGTPAIDASAEVDEVESVAYRPENGHTYIVEDSSHTTNDARIYEYDGSGSYTGESLKLPSGVQHGYNFEWHDGRAWIADWHDSTGDIHIMDWDEKSHVKTITQNGAVSGASWAWVATVPTVTGTKKMLFVHIGSAGGYLVDMDDAYADGQTDGNIETPLENTFNNYYNGGEWVNGYLVWATHRVVGRSQMPHADRMRDGFPVGNGYGVEWICDPDQGNQFDGLSYNPDTGEIYLGVGAQVYAYKEAMPGGQSGYSDSEVARGGVGQPRVLDLTGGSTSFNWFDLLDSPRAGRVEWWYYDDTETSAGSGKEMYAAVANDTTDDRITLGVNTTTTNGDANFSRWNNTDGWEDTGVARPANPQWVCFAWTATGNEMKLQISKDFGATWADAGTKTGRATTIRQATAEARSGSAQYGQLRILPQYE